MFMRIFKFISLFEQENLYLASTEIGSTSKMGGQGLCGNTGENRKKKLGRNEASDLHARSRRGR